MKIKEIKIWNANLENTKPYTIAFKTTDLVMNAFVEITLQNGITGIGSIMFRDEEYLLSNCKIPPQEYYEKVIAPYKGALEIWYNQHKSFFVDISIIFLTAWLIVFPKSNAAHTVFKNLPAQKL